MTKTGDIPRIDQETLQSEYEPSLGECQALCESLGELTAGEQIRIYNDARQAARAHFCTPRAPRPKEMLREVKAALRSARISRPYVRAISPHTWLYTGRMVVSRRW